MNCRIRLSYGHNAVVAHGATTGNAGMIKGTIHRQCQFEKVGGIVTVIAFDDSRQMKFGFADGQYVVVTFAAITKYLLVVDGRDDKRSNGRANRGRRTGKSHGGMAGFAGIAGSEVVWRFTRNLARPRYKIYLAVMTLHAI